MPDRRVITGEPEDENEDEVQQPGTPPGTVFIGDEGVAHPGDGTAWIGDIVVSSDWYE